MTLDEQPRNRREVGFVVFWHGSHFALFVLGSVDVGHKPKNLVVVVVVRGGMQVLWLVNALVAEVETRWRNVKACQLRPLPVRLVSPYAL